jgi:hypothetical protein
VPKRNFPRGLVARWFFGPSDQYQTWNVDQPNMCRDLITRLRDGQRFRTQRHWYTMSAVLRATVRCRLIAANIFMICELSRYSSVQGLNVAFVSKGTYWHDEQGQHYDQDPHLSHELHNTDEICTVNTQLSPCRYQKVICPLGPPKSTPAASQRPIAAESDHPTRHGG